MKKYDAIIIGAGNGGLSAAAVLAKGGKKVLVLERSHIPGGFATSFRRGRFDFEVSLHELCGFGRYDKPFGGVRQLFDHLGISDKIDWVDIKDAYRIITFDSASPIDVTMPFGIDEYVNKMEQYVPGSKKGTQSFFELGDEYLKALNDIGKVKKGKEQLKSILAHPDFLHTCSKSTNEVLDSLGLPKKAKEILEGYWAYLCADCNNITFLHYIMMMHSYIELKSVIPKSRSLEISLRLCECITQNGGEIMLNTEVTKILVKNNAAYGVLTADKNEYHADYVIANVSPHTVLGKLIDKENLNLFDIKKTNARQFSGRGFCVYLGLNKSAEEIGLTDYSYFIYPDMDTEKQFRLMGSPDTNRVQNTVCQNAAYPEASPQGTSILTMTTLFTSDYWETVEEKNYFKEKSAFADKMISTFETATKLKIRPYIEEIEIAAPQTFAHFTDTPKGAIYGYLAAGWDGMLARQTMDKPYSSIKGLEFVGGYADKLNGYSSAMATGYDSARFILRSQKSADEVNG